MNDFLPYESGVQNKKTAHFVSFHTDSAINFVQNARSHLDTYTKHPQSYECMQQFGILIWALIDFDPLSNVGMTSTIFIFAAKKNIIYVSMIFWRTRFWILTENKIGEQYGIGDEQIVNIVIVCYGLALWLMILGLKMSPLCWQILIVQYNTKKKFYKKLGKYL